MKYEIHNEAERAASFSRIDALLPTMRGGPGDRDAAETECDARLTAIFAFDIDRAMAGDPAAQARVATYRAANLRSRVRGMEAVFPEPPEPTSAPPRAIKAAAKAPPAPPPPPDPRDAVLSAMRAANKANGYL